MNDQELRAYAIAGVTARLAAIDEERAALQELLARFTAATGVVRSVPTAERVADEVRVHVVTRGRRRDVARPATAETVADAVTDIGAPAVEEPEVARQLPRRGRLRRHDETTEVVAVPQLPPMPRLVKSGDR